MPTFLRPLDDLLTSRAKVRLVRALLSQARPVSGREAARLAHLSQTPALRALDDLVALGVLHRTETTAQHLYEVNPRNRLVREGLAPLFHLERERVGHVVERLRSILAGDAGVVSAAVFGSAARAEDAPGSDFDVLALTSTRADAERVHARLADAIPAFAEEFGLDLSPVVLPLEQFREMHRSGDPLPAAVLRDARLVLGKPPEELVDG